MYAPISPPPLKGGGRDELPAYVSNGVMGLRIREIPLWAGLTLLNGFSGEHPIQRIEGAAVAPYPIAGDIQVAGVWMSQAAYEVTVLDQTYDFASGELKSRFDFEVQGVKTHLEVLTFCSREEPSLVCQKISFILDNTAEIVFQSIVDARPAEGRALRSMRDLPGESQLGCDGTLFWESLGGLSTCGIAYATELKGHDCKPVRPVLDNNTLTTSYQFKAEAGKLYSLRQFARLIPSVTHNQPDFQAARLVALARKRGFETIQTANRAIWSELWKGRIRLVGAGAQWQGLADAAFFYLISSTHVGSPASTSIFGLATWHDYHYYYGHVMWDIETFVVPLLSLLQPHVAESILEYRWRNIEGAAANARVRGRRGLQFPWESAPSSGQEAAPLPGSASWHEDHVSLDVARAFAFHAYATGNMEFLRSKAWPVLSGVANWITSRVTFGDRGYEILSAMGIAERETEADNAAFTNMAAVVALRDAVEAARQLGYAADPSWAKIADSMFLPMRDRIIVSHDGFRSNEEKGGTPDPLMGVFPLGFGMPPDVEAATLDFYLNLRKGYMGSPMLSALYGVWAAYTGDRVLSAELMEDGYGRFCVGRFLQTLEYREDDFPSSHAQDRFLPIWADFCSVCCSDFQGCNRGQELLTLGSGAPSSFQKAGVL